MSIAGAYFAGMLAATFLLLGFRMISQRHATIGWALVIAVILFTVFGGYVSFSL